MSRIESIRGCHSVYSFRDVGLGKDFPLAVDRDGRVFIWLPDDLSGSFCSCVIGGVTYSLRSLGQVRPVGDVSRDWLEKERQEDDSRWSTREDEDAVELRCGPDSTACRKSWKVTVWKKLDEHWLEVFDFGEGDLSELGSDDCIVQVQLMR